MVFRFKNKAELGSNKVIISFLTGFKGFKPGSVLSIKVKKSSNSIKILYKLVVKNGKAYKNLDFSDELKL